MLALVAVLSALSTAPVAPMGPGVSVDVADLVDLAHLADSSYLYRTLLVRAAPGKLLEVIDLYKKRLPVYDAGDGRPWILRHSQGDQWDLMLLFPVGNLSQYYSAGAQARRAQAAAGSGITEAAFDSAMADRVAWREEVFVQGPPLAEMQARMSAGAFYHIEMFVALPGKYRELKRERDMESAFNATFGRPQNLLLTRVAGAAWDMFTVGVYRDIKHFAESADIPPARRDSAARAVGFPSADQIGPYLRTLISYHHDTLAGAVQP